MEDPEHEAQDGQDEGHQSPAALERLADSLAKKRTELPRTPPGQPLFADLVATGGHPRMVEFAVVHDMAYFRMAELLEKMYARMADAERVIRDLARERRHQLRHGADPTA